MERTAPSCPHPLLWGLESPFIGWVGGAERGREFGEVGEKPSISGPPVLHPVGSVTSIRTLSQLSYVMVP